MLNTYTTISGDTWDIVAYKAYGNEMYMDTLIKANLEHKDTYIFPGRGCTYPAGNRIGGIGIPAALEAGRDNGK